METNIESLEMPPNSSTNIEREITDMRHSIEKMADALIKLALLEERHQVTQSRVEKVEDKLAEYQRKLNEVEIAQITHMAKLKGMTSTLRILWVVVGGVVAAVVSKIILTVIHA